MDLLHSKTPRFSVRLLILIVHLSRAVGLNVSWDEVSGLNPQMDRGKAFLFTSSKGVDVMVSVLLMLLAPSFSYQVCHSSSFGVFCRAQLLLCVGLPWALRLFGKECWLVWCRAFHREDFLGGAEGFSVVDSKTPSMLMFLNIQTPECPIVFSSSRVLFYLSPTRKYIASPTPGHQQIPPKPTPPQTNPLPQMPHGSKCHWSSPPSANIRKPPTVALAGYRHKHFQIQRQLRELCRGGRDAGCGHHWPRGERGGVEHRRLVEVLPGAARWWVKTSKSLVKMKPLARYPGDFW